MHKRFCQVVTTSLLCLIALMQNDKTFAQHAPDNKCASVEVRSPGNQYQWYNFNYKHCETGQQVLAQSHNVGSDLGQDAIAFSNKVAVGTTVDMGQWGIGTSHMTPPNDVVRPGENKYICNNNSDGKCRRVK